MNLILLSILGIFFAALIPLYLYDKRKRDERIKNVRNTFFDKYQNDGRAIKLLIPSGINGLKNNNEINSALNDIKNRLGNHPLRDWDKKIKKIGYKKFFNFVVTSRNALTKSTIGILINDYKKQGG